MTSRIHMNSQPTVQRFRQKAEALYEAVVHVARTEEEEDLRHFPR